VQADGIHFSLNGERYLCSGTNAYYAGLKYIMSDSEVAYMMEEQAKRGVTVMRVFAFSNFDSVPDPIMPEFGVFNEDALKRLDLMLVAMAQNGIRAIMVLGNYWNFLGGFQSWVDQRYPGENKDLEEFYTDNFLKSQYKLMIQKIITRTNTITGLPYMDDPTIFSWETANEPRATDNYEKKRGIQPGSLICAWVEEMTSYIRSLDTNHMVSIGDEGMMVDGGTAEPHSWINNGYEGVDFKCNLKYADFATIHSYPDAWGMSADGGYRWLGENYYERRAKIARKNNKPIILEEYGMRRGYLPSRDKLFYYIQNQVNRLQFACTLVWAVSHYSTTGDVYGYNDGQGYVFAYTSDDPAIDTNGVRPILDQNKYIANANSGMAVYRPTCDDVSPNSVSCARNARNGRCKLPLFQDPFCRQSCNRC